MRTRTALFRSLSLCLTSFVVLGFAGCGDTTSGGDDAGSCTAPLASCGRLCVDVTSDDKNCGACGMACAIGTSCVGGKCQCPKARPDLCGTGDNAFCTDLKTDDGNCGACGTACALGQSCVSGKCACPAVTPNACGQGDGAFCTNTQSDGANCGACGTACSVGQNCVGGKCACPGFIPDACGSGGAAICTNLQTDGQNCGACGTVCPPAQTCVAGACACMGLLPNACGMGPATICTNFQSDNANCGGCGMVCPVGQVCTANGCALSCGGLTPDMCMSNGNPLCTSLQTDSQNCGACGNACPASQSCAAGRCACPANIPNGCGMGQNVSCVSFDSDVANCGGCGMACPKGQGCAGGKCGCPMMSPDACVANGNTICTNLQADPSNCGGCGSACPRGQSCNAGKCGCPAQLPDYCGQLQRCTSLQADPFNCGACGSTCFGGMCAAGKCNCLQGGTLCNGRCLNTMSDPANCGACGKACGQGQLCAGGVCGAQCGANTMACQTPAPALGHSLLGWWSFDNPNDALRDDTLRGKSATAQNGFATAAGRIGSAMSAGGFHPDPSFGLAGRSFTIEMWVKPSDLSGNPDRALFLQCGNWANSTCLHVTLRGGNPYLGFGNDDLRGKTVLQANSWYHVAATFDATTRAQSLYVNGVLDATRTSAGQVTPSGSFDVGASAVPFTTAFAGLMDEVKVWAYARSAGEIVADAAAPTSCATVTGADTGNCGACNAACPTNATCAAGTCACGQATPTLCGTLAAPGCFDTMTDVRACGGCGVTCVPGIQECSAGACTTTPPARLLGFWNFESSVSADASGNNRNITWSNAPNRPNSASATGGFFYLDNTSAFSGSVTSPNLGGSFTIESWVYLPAVAAGGQDNWLWGTCNSPSQDHCLHLTVRNGHPYFGFFGDDTVGGTTLAAKTWYHLAYAYDAATKTRAIYVNGVLDGTGVAVANFVQGNAPSYIDSVPPGIWGGIPMGYVDDVKVYAYARSAAQVFEEATLIGSYPLEGNLNDESQSAHLLRQSGVLGFGAGAYGKGLVLPGSGVSAMAPNGLLGGSIPFTVELWFNAAGPGVLFAEQGNNAPNSQWHDAWITLTPGGELILGVWGCMNPSLDGGKVAFNSWTHVALTYDQKILAAYVNGVAVGKPLACARQTPAAAGNLAWYGVGMADSTVPAGGSSAAFNGMVDELRIYDRVLSPAEVAAEALR